MGQFHFQLAGGDLHNPKGRDPTPLDIPDNVTTSYIIRDDEGTPNNYLLISTEDGLEKIDFGSVAKNPKYNFLGTGTATFNGSLQILSGVFAFTGSNFDLDPTGSFRLDMDSGQPIVITLSDNKGDAFTVRGEDLKTYFKVSTLDGAEEIRYGDSVINPVHFFTGPWANAQQSAPDVSDSDTGRIYFDSTSKTYKVSEDGAAYTDMLGGASSVIYGATGPASVAIATTYFAIVGKIVGTNATEANVQLKMRASGTLKKFRVFVSSNTHDATTTILIRKNGANGNQVVEYLTLATGQKEDLVNTDTFVDGDLISIELTTFATSGIMTIELCQVESV